MTEDKIPQVIMPPDMQAELDANPELAKAMQGMKEAMLNAMQGVEDGRYASFEDAMEALTGHRPVKHVFKQCYETKYGYRYAIGPDPSGDGYMAVISDGDPRQDPECIILDVTRVKTREEGEAWANRQIVLEPWVDSADEIVPLDDEDEDATVTVGDQDKGGG